MAYVQIVFSPTGGTARVAGFLTAPWPGEIKTVDLCDRKTDFATVELTSDDLVAIAVPSFAGRVPGLAAERIRALRGNGARAVLVAVYGNRDYDDTLVELEDLATAVGFTVIAGVAAVARHSMVPAYAAGRPNAEDAIELEDFGVQILHKAEAQKSTLPNLPGNRPYRDGMQGGPLPLTNDNCIDCKLCATSCPSGAIDFDDVAKIDPDLCISCLRCVAVCPVEAKYIDPENVQKLKEALREVCSIPKANELYL